MLRMRAIAGTAVLGLLLAACSSSSSATPPATAPPAPASSAAPATSAGPSVATLTQDNFAFSPTKLTVKSGSTITLTDANAATSHNFTIDGQGVNVTNAPGQSQDVTLNLQPGTYPFYCSFHVSQGMKGTLTVT
jgi:plastocyanin